jgi:hypothetical protein
MSTAWFSDTVELTDAERELLACDCPNSDMCPIHADMPDVWADVPASELIARAETIIAARLRAHGETIAAAIEALPAHHFTTIRGAIRESAQIAREAS